MIDIVERMGPTELIAASSNMMIAVVLLFLATQASAVYRRYERKERIKYAISLVQTWTEHDYMRVLLNVYSSLGAREIVYLEAERYADLFVKNREHYHALVSVLNFFEQVAQAVEEGVADDDAVERSLGPIIVGVYNDLEKFVFLTREHNGNPLAFRSTERLVGRWSFGAHKGGDA